MKINELLNELRITPPGKHVWKSYRTLDQTSYGRKKDDPVRRYQRHGQMYGKAGDWMVAAGATREDIPLAMAKARQSKEYQDLIDMGMDDDTNRVETANGTFRFSGIPGEQLTDTTHEDGPTQRRVLVSGKVVGLSSGRYRSSRLKSDHPATVETHPDLSPIDRLVLNYTRAFKRIHDVQKPKFVKAFKKRILSDT